MSFPSAIGVLLAKYQQGAFYCVKDAKMFGKKKTCTKCDKTKSVRKFHRDKSAKDNYTRRCKVCISAYDRSEKGRSATKRHSRTDKRKQSNKQYNQSEKGKQSRKQFNQSEKGKQVTERYTQSERGQQLRRTASAKRRAIKNNAEGSYTQDEWDALCAKYDYKCVSYHKKKPLTVDHIKPLSKGGTNYISNIQPLCSPCNLSKGTKATDYR